MKKGQKRPSALQAKPPTDYRGEVARLKDAIERQILAVRRQFGASAVVKFD